MHTGIIVTIPSNYILFFLQKFKYLVEIFKSKLFFSPTNTAGLELIQLPAASHDDLMSHIRAHPTWFVHMNFDGKHSVTKLPPAGKAGDTALNLKHPKQ